MNTTPIMFDKHTTSAIIRTSIHIYFDVDDVMFVPSGDVTEGQEKALSMNEAW